MLGWITGQNGDGADDSRVLEPPETPAPVFAIRAFKSALFGTPGAEEDADGERTMLRKTRPVELPRSQKEAQKPSIEKLAAIDVPKQKDPDNEIPQPPPAASPTKSILVTPGTTSNRRKTVSFGESVMDNERKKDEQASKATKLTPSGNVSSQWASTPLDGKNKGRSKLTQSLLDARNNPSLDPPKLESKPVKSPKATDSVARDQQEEDPEDVTINLDDPRSQSGKYWKAEFESYRVKTNREIKKLIQYRSVAKSYARKKDAESLRLAEKLKEEEAKVADMERHVSNLASTMVGTKGDADKEKLVQDLTKQTALALQYKHKVNRLRKLLERHGVVGSDAEQQDDDTISERREEDLRKTKQALDQANAKIEQLSLQNTDLERLQDLARASEQKAASLEKENATLKQSLSRVKQEMTKYEGRRKEKEAKLKQREAKLEARNQEYRERLKAANQERRDAEQSFSEERQRMQEHIDALQGTITSLGLSKTGTGAAHAYSPAKRFSGVETYDFALEPQNGYASRQRELEEPGSPSPASKRDSRQMRRNATDAVPDRRRLSKRPPMDDNDEDPIITLEGSPSKYLAYHSDSRRTKAVGAVPPSSPPDIFPSEYRSHVSPQKVQYDQPSRRVLPSPRPTMINFSASPEKSEDHARHTTHRSRQTRHRTSNLPPILHTVPAEPALLDNGRTGSLASVKRNAMSPERLAAAQARLQQRKHEGRKSQEILGKENMRAYFN
ncbi:conserved hypothetical protein [Paecilomyces variotii No. 5]|uniref:Spindle pole body-associated protein cut12 domain-containing protein n=1 Tax=Byssochlamys spectabilis (strain No. 5 / NBRC 109023) TaxID=1356009 RepID=V5FJL3_BYSSN|nr:conserved hypothetical protein [Paecilomyces variotii No. 5]